MDTLALPNDTQSALKQSEVMCVALKEKLNLAGRDESNLQEISERKESLGKKMEEKAESYQRELPDRLV